MDQGRGETPAFLLDAEPEGYGAPVRRASKISCSLYLSQAAGKLFSEGVILSAAKDLLFARAEIKADPSIA